MELHIPAKFSYAYHKGWKSCSRLCLLCIFYLIVQVNFPSPVQYCFKISKAQTKRHNYVKILYVQIHAKICAHFSKDAEFSAQTLIIFFFAGIGQLVMWSFWKKIPSRRRCVISKFPWYPNIYLVHVIYLQPLMFHWLTLSSGLKVSLKKIKKPKILQHKVNVL